MKNLKNFIAKYLFPGVAVLFGVITLAEGGKTLFFSDQQKLSQTGVVVPVLIFNFISGFFYIITGVTAFFSRKKAFLLALVLISAIALMTAWFIWHVVSGNNYMPKTGAAMLFRLGFWTGFVFWAKKIPR